MPWFKVDDALYGHPKWLATPPAARALWVSAGSWCAAHLQDGHVPRHVLGTLGGRPRDAAELVRVGLWHAAGDGWTFHDWLEMQPSSEQVSADRAAARERQRRARERARESQPRHGVTDSEVQPGVTVPPTRPDPTPYVDTPVAANGTSPAARQQRIEEACRTLADERAATRDVGPGWAPAAARGLATDHHQALHNHLAAHPDASSADLIGVMDAPKLRPEPVNTSSRVRPVAEVLADRPERDGELNAGGAQQARAALRGGRTEGAA